MQFLLRFKRYGYYQTINITNIITKILSNLKSEIKKNNIDFSFADDLKQNITLHKINADIFIKQLEDITTLLITNSTPNEKIQVTAEQDTNNFYIRIKSNGYFLSLINCPHNKILTRYSENANTPSLESFLTSLKLSQVNYSISQEAGGSYCLELQYKIA